MQIQQLMCKNENLKTSLVGEEVCGRSVRIDPRNNYESKWAIPRWCLIAECNEKAEYKHLAVGKPQHC